MFGFPSSFFGNNDRRNDFGFDSFFSPRRTDPYYTREYQRPYSHQGSARNYPRDPMYEEPVCSGCGETPIEGTRYECSVCPSFNFCSECAHRRRHPHKFFRRDPEEEQQHIRRPSTKQQQAPPKEQKSRTPTKPERQEPKGYGSFEKENRRFENQQKPQPKPQSPPQQKTQAKPQPSPQQIPRAKPTTVGATQIPTNYFPNKANMAIIRDELKNKVVDFVYF